MAAKSNPVVQYEAGVLTSTPCQGLHRNRSLMCYLFSKVTSKSMLHLDQDQIKDFDLYGEKEPSEIWDLHGGCNLQSNEDLYFFTKLKKKSQNGSRINRSVGTGTWMGEDSGKPIHSQLSATQPLGFKRRFRYEGGVPQQRMFQNPQTETLGTSLAKS
ncbi:NAC domain - like 10 [Theobroma cacao]|nr:NAC domain - like 10 [Theobroma cacao]